MTNGYNLGDLIDRGRDLDKVAVIDFDGTCTTPWTYRDLDNAASGVARALSARRYPHGARIAILSANRFEYIVAYFGIMRAGLVAVPINFKLPSHLVEFILRDCDAQLVFCDGARRGAVLPDRSTVSFDDEFREFQIDGPFTATVPGIAEPALFLYTSGSTGKPKGVVLSHESQLWTLDARLERVSYVDERLLIAAPLYHMNALSLAMLASRAHASMVLLPQFTPEVYLKAIARLRCTWLTSVPSMIAMLMQKIDLLKTTDFSSVRSLRMGSAPIGPALLTAINRVLHVTVTNAYGTTEAGPVVFGPHPAGLLTPPLSVGFPHHKVEVRLIDAANEPAEEGILRVRSLGIMVGYHNRPDLPLAITHDGFYVTGDVFRRDENGFYYFVGRSDDMFVSGGENIFPTEVERMLELHPEVEQACVVPLEDAIKGCKPVAFVVRKQGSALSAQTLKAFALRSAAAYQHPRFVWFLDQLPLASTNKLDRAHLKELARKNAAALRL